MRRPATACLVAGCLPWPLGAQAAVIEGQHFDDRIRLADTELVLNGVGLRAVAWLKGYAAGLYLRAEGRARPRPCSR